MGARAAFRAPLLCLVAVALMLGGASWPHVAYSHDRVTTSVTYDREIVRILTRRCLTCHSERNLAFPLTTYEETRPWARAIHEEVLARHMPPWRAVAGYGRFANDGGLTQRELQTMAAWIEGAGPKSADQTVIVNIDQGITSENQRLKPDFESWHLGLPDVRRPLAIQSVGPIPPSTAVVRASIDLGWTTARRVRGFEFKPRDRRGLRAATFSLEGTGQWLASWTPWHGTLSLPPTAAYLIPAGARVTAELYYRGPREEDRDGGELGIYVAGQATPNCPADRVLRTTGAIAPHTRNQKLQALARLQTDTTLLALIPELHERTHSFEVRARQPDGTVTTLLVVRDVLHDWPTPYIFETPLRLPAGTEVVVTSYSNNDGDGALPADVGLRVSAYAGGCSQGGTSAGRNRRPRQR